eukprot:5445489-Alexandrium_andersonii.AAC.1
MLACGLGRSHSAARDMGRRAMTCAVLGLGLACAVAGMRAAAELPPPPTFAAPIIISFEARYTFASACYTVAQAASAA